VRAATGELRGAGERGTAIVLALFFSVLVIGLTTTGALTLRAHMQSARTSFVSRTQAVQIARSGLTDALSWMRRQTSQPVLTFEPTLDASASPPILDTIDPAIGLVREFRITNRTWARYEVWKQWEADPDPERLAWRRAHQCEDVSVARAGSSLGSVWRLRSVGYVYQRIDATVPFNQTPNQIVASHVAVNEVRRLVVNLPGHAAVNVGDGNSCHINTNGRIIGGPLGAGVYYPAGTGSPTTGPANQNRVTGAPAIATAVDYDDSYKAVFGISFNELLAVATQVIRTGDPIPSPMPSMGLVVFDVGNTLRFDSATPLRGTAAVVVRGNCAISQNSNSNFSGLLYVDGNLTVRDPCDINGSVICTGNLTVQGMPDYSTITFDGNILDVLLGKLGVYRVANATTLPRLERR
jgi:hypothetical protein